MLQVKVVSRDNGSDDEVSLCPGNRCTRHFYSQPCRRLAIALLGCVLVCGECRGVIVETEAYLGLPDKAAHSHGGRKTPRNSAMFMSPGTSYVYSIYGMHYCFNVSSGGEGCAVLVRAVEPVEGVGVMRERRKGRESELCNGPGKLCQAMGISKTHDKLDLVTSDVVWVEVGKRCGEVMCSGRVGVEYAEEWADKPLRFYLESSSFVSRVKQNRHGQLVALTLSAD